MTDATNGANHSPDKSMRQLTTTCPLRLEFIEHGDNSARKRARSHAMKDVQRRRRWESIRSIEYIRLPGLPTAAGNRPAVQDTRMFKQDNKKDNKTACHKQPVQQPPVQYAESSKSGSDLPRMHHSDSRHHGAKQPAPTRLVRAPKMYPLRVQQPLIPSLEYQNTKEDTTEPSLADDEGNTTESESQRDSHSEPSPPSDSQEDSPAESQETAWYPRWGEDFNHRGYHRFIPTARKVYEDTSADEEIFNHSYSPADDTQKEPPPMSSLNPFSMVSAARYDPFDSLAKTVMPEERALVDHRTTSSLKVHL